MPINYSGKAESGATRAPGGAVCRPASAGGERGREEGAVLRTGRCGVQACTSRRREREGGGGSAADRAVRCACLHRPPA